MDYGIIDIIMRCEYVSAFCIGLFEQTKNKQSDKVRIWLYGDSSGLEYVVFDRGNCVMVNFFKKKKKDETFANGRVIVTSFKELKKDDFPHENWDMFFLHYDGRIYVDSENKANEAIISILKILVQYPKAELRRYYFWRSG